MDTANHKSPHLSDEDLSALKEIYDKNKDGILSPSEIRDMIHQYNNKTLRDERVKKILDKYDLDGNGKIDIKETQHLEHSISLQESQFRYTAYTVGLSRIFRYLAFTSDFGEALRPVVHRTIVTGSYAVAFAYCIADVGWETYKTYECNSNPQSPYHQGEDGEKYSKMTVTQCFVERSAFQALASLAIPAVVIHQSVHISKNIFAKLGRFTKWGPSIVGLSIIPLLPTYLDHPVEQGIEYFFHHYGPWANKQHKD
jgi:mitochondrial fission process protein 1